FCCYVYIQLAQLLDISEILRRDLGDGNVVDVDVLLANQIEQQVEWAFVNAGNGDREREVIGLSFRAGLSRGRHRSRRKIVNHFGVFGQCVTLLLGRSWARRSRATSSWPHALRSSW